MDRANFYPTSFKIRVNTVKDERRRKSNFAERKGDKNNDGNAIMAAPVRFLGAAFRTWQELALY